MPSVMRIMLKDLVDFLLVFSVSLMLAIVVYRQLPAFIPVTMSVYFFEQYVEFLLINPKFLWCLLGLGLLVNVLYVLLFVALLKTTVGGFLMGIRLVHSSDPDISIGIGHALLLSLGSYFGATILFVGPLWAWWIDPKHRGFAELMLCCSWVKAPRAFPKAA